MGGNFFPISSSQKSVCAFGKFLQGFSCSSSKNADKQFQWHVGLAKQHICPPFCIIPAPITYMLQCWELTWHLWYADGTAAAALAPFAQSFDLNEVVFSSGDLKLHTGFIGLQHRSHAVPGLTIHNLQGKHGVCWKQGPKSADECVKCASCPAFCFQLGYWILNVSGGCWCGPTRSEEAFTNRVFGVFVTHRLKRWSVWLFKVKGTRLNVVSVERS